MKLSELIRKFPEEVMLALRDAARWYDDQAIPGPAGKAASKFSGGVTARHFTKNNAAEYGYKPLSPAYKREKDRKFPGKPTLVRTGAMRNSIVGQASIRASGRKGQVKARLEWRKAVDYAKYHEKGKGVPKRSPVQPNARDAKDLRAVVVRFIKARMQARRRRTREATRSPR